MAYTINDKTLVQELCGDDFRAIIDEEKNKLEKKYTREFVHPLDREIVGQNGKLEKLLSGAGDKFLYSSADNLDKLWTLLLDKSIQCLRYFDDREPFVENDKKEIVSYGIDNLEKYHKRYTDFEGLLYGSSTHYRDHVFHSVRVWMLGVFCLMKKENEESNCFYSDLIIEGGAEMSHPWNFFECLSMWTIVALCHDLGYPLEKAEIILESTRKMMKEFIPNPNVWNNFGFNGIQDNINEYILKFISTKMKLKKEQPIKEQDSVEYVGRIQPKYYLKYAKSLEKFQHGILSTVIVYKMLLYFLESDFNLNDDYTYKEEDARQFYIRREILRAMAAHTCPEAYNVHLYTFSSLLFMCDELQEWGRKRWNDLYTGVSEDSTQLIIETFKKDRVDVSETVDMKTIQDQELVANNICSLFERQYSLYKTTFRDGQYTAKRDFDIYKTMKLQLSNNGATVSEIEIKYELSKYEGSKFQVDLKNYQGNKKGLEGMIRKKIGHSKLYTNSLVFTGD